MPEDAPEEPIGRKSESGSAAHLAEEGSQATRRNEDGKEGRSLPRGKEELPPPPGKGAKTQATRRNEDGKEGRSLPRGKEELPPPPGKGAKAKAGRKRKFTFLELFAGLAGLSLAVSEAMQYATVLTHDIKLGMDLLEEDDFMETHRLCEVHDVDWVHMAPVCRTMSRARRNDKHGRVKTLRTDDRPEGFG